MVENTRFQSTRSHPFLWWVLGGSNIPYPTLLSFIRDARLRLSFFFGEKREGSNPSPTPCLMRADRFRLSMVRLRKRHKALLVCFRYHQHALTPHAEVRELVQRLTIAIRLHVPLGADRLSLSSHCK